MDENEKKDMKKSELDKAQIEASKKELEELRTQMAKYAKAAGQLLAGTVKLPVHAALEQISEKYEAAKAEVSRRYGLLVEVEEKRGQQNDDIGTIAEGQRTDSKKVRDEQLGKSESAILSTEARMKDAGNGIKTFFGSVAARMAKTPFTFAARWQALRGNESKAHEMSGKAQDMADKVMGAIKKENDRVQGNLGKRIDTHSEVIKNSKDQKTLTGIRREADRANRETFENKGKGLDRVIRKAVGLDMRMRAGKGFVLSEIARKGREIAGRTAAIVGRTEEAKKISTVNRVQDPDHKDRTVDDDPMRSALIQNRKLRTEVSKNLKSADYNRGRVDSTISKINEGVQKDQMDAEAWIEEQKGSRADNLAARGQEGEKVDAKLSRRERHARTVTKLALGMDKIQDLRSKGELKVVGMGATVLALMGKRQQARDLVSRAQQRINGREVKDGKEAIVGYQEKGKAQRDAVLSVAKRAFSFRDRKAQDIDKVVGDVKAIPGTVKTVAERGAAKVDENYHRGLGKVLSALRAAPAALAAKLDKAIENQEEKVVAAQNRQSRISGKDGKDEGTR